MIGIAERAVLVTLLLMSALETPNSLAKEMGRQERVGWTLDHDDDDGHVSLAVEIPLDPDDDFDEDYIISHVIQHLGCDWEFQNRYEKWLHFSAPNAHKDFPTYDPYRD
jgi:hypothetical protein